MKIRVLKKQTKQVLDSALPTTFKLSAMHQLIELSEKSSWFQYKSYPYVRFDRFSTTLHKGIVTVSEHDSLNELRFSSWKSAMIWISKQAKRVGEYGVEGPEYIIDSGHYRYRTNFPERQE
jgi:hypothetical protein